MDTVTATVALSTWRHKKKMFHFMSIGILFIYFESLCVVLNDFRIRKTGWMQIFFFFFFFLSYFSYKTCVWMDVVYWEYMQCVFEYISITYRTQNSCDWETADSSELSVFIFLVMFLLLWSAHTKKSEGFECCERISLLWGEKFKWHFGLEMSSLTRMKCPAHKWQLKGLNGLGVMNLYLKIFFK